MVGNTSRRRMAAALVVALASAACNEPPPSPPPAKSANPRLSLPSSGPLEGLEAPDDALLFGGANAPSRVLRLSLALAGGIDPAEPLGHDAATAVATRYGLKSGDALDLTKPMRLALFDPSAHDEPWLVAVSTHGRARLVASLPEGKQAASGGNDYSWAAGDRRTYLTFVEDYALFSNDETLAPKQHAFMTKLIAAELGSDVAMRVASRRIAKLLVAPEPSDAGVPEPAWQPVAQALSASVDDVLVRADVVDPGLSLRVRVIPKAGSDVAATMAGLGSHRPDPSLPAGSALALAIGLDADHDDALTRLVTAWALQLGDAGGDEDERYDRARRELWKATTGELGFAVHTVGNDGHDACSVWLGVRDAVKARAAMTTLRSRPQHDSAMAKTYRDEGMVASFNEQALRVGDVKVDEVKVQLSDRGHTGDEPAAARRVLTSLLHSFAAVSGERAIITFGEHGDEAMRAWLEGHVSLGTGALGPMLKAGPAHTFAVALLDPGRLLTLLPLDGGRAPEAAARHAPITLVASASDGGVDFTLRVERGQLAPFATLLSSLRRQF